MSELIINNGTWNKPIADCDDNELGLIAIHCAERGAKLQAEIVAKRIENAIVRRKISAILTNIK